ncbi:MAG: TonB-dependent receptor [Bacteroidales bacterium]|nr:TonB-dependent receptor [Bacteroidales bacterium]
MKFLINTVLLLCLIFCVRSVNAMDGDAGRITISGTISDGKTGEMLLGATIYVKELASGTTSNLYGFYSFSLEPGKYHLVYSFIGYENIERAVEIQKSQRINIELLPKAEMLEEVVITGERKGENLIRTEMSVVKMDARTIGRIPALMGEVDLIKALQLLPGVSMASEGSSGFSVRGGAPDQNQILLDEASVYNASHLMGFFSVFNNDAIKDVKIYKGDIPAAYGGRLSSVLDIRMKDGNSKQFSGTGGIGTISSRLTLEGPLVSENTTFIASGRRTYADLFLALSSDENVRNNTLYFYDFNTKITHKISDNDRVFISGYFGRDVFKNKFASMDFGNQTLTTRWNHLFSDRLFSNFSVIYSKYDYAIGTPDGQANSFIWTSKMRDYSAKTDFTYFINPDNTLKFGSSTTFHQFDPGSAKGTGDESYFGELIMPKQYSLENAVYISNEQKVGSRLSFKYGLRFSAFTNVAPATIYTYSPQFIVSDSAVYTGSEFFHTYFALEPRFGATYQLDEVSSIKLNYTRTNQYIQLAQNSTAGTPLDVWFAVSPNIEPQVSDQLIGGYFRNFDHNTYEASVEAYYKRMDNAIDFKDQADLLFNKYIEGDLRIGNAWAYGLEFLIRKNEGALTGWIGYSYSVAKRKIEGINNGDTYTSPYNKPHELSVVASYEFSKRYSLAANWVYSTGAPVTFPTGRAVIGGNVIPVYSDRNAYRMPDYHRLDVSFVVKPRPKPNRKFNYEWNFSLYNAYGRKNAWSINFIQDEQNPEVTYAEKTYLFGIIPSITFNFTF